MRRSGIGLGAAAAASAAPAAGAAGTGYAPARPTGSSSSLLDGVRPAGGAAITSSVAGFRAAPAASEADSHAYGQQHGARAASPLPNGFGSGPSITAYGFSGGVAAAAAAAAAATAAPAAAPAADDLTLTSLQVGLSCPPPLLRI